MKFLVTVLSLIFSVTSFASPPKPQSCPNINLLKAVHFAKAYNDHEEWLPYVHDNFNTNMQWTFMSAYQGTELSKEESIKKANDSVSQTRFLDGPELDRGPDGMEHWFCFYLANNNMEVAVTPVAPFPLRAFMHH